MGHSAWQPPPLPPATWDILGVHVLALIPASGGARPPSPATATAAVAAPGTAATSVAAPDDGDDSDGDDDTDDAGVAVTLAESDAAVLSVTVPAPAEAVWEPDVLERLATAVLPVSPHLPAGGAAAAMASDGCGCGDGGPTTQRRRRRAVRVAFEEAVVWQYYQPISGAGYVFREKAGSL